MKNIILLLIMFVTVAASAQMNFKYSYKYSPDIDIKDDTVYKGNYTVAVANDMSKVVIIDDCGNTVHNIAEITSNKQFQLTLKSTRGVKIIITTMYTFICEDGVYITWFIQILMQKY